MWRHYELTLGNTFRLVFLQKEYHIQGVPKKLVFRISTLYGFSFPMLTFRGLLDILGGFLHQNQKLPSHIKGILLTYTPIWSITMLLYTVRVKSIQIPKDQFFSVFKQDLMKSFSFFWFWEFWHLVLGVCLFEN